MARIENRFAELLEAKRRRDRKDWTYREIQEATGINPATLTRFAKQRHNQYDGDTLVTLCEFLGCTLGELLVIVPNGDGQESGQPVAVA